MERALEATALILLHSLPSEVPQRAAVTLGRSAGLWFNRLRR